MQWIMVIAVFIAADLMWLALCKVSSRADKSMEKLKKEGNLNE